jgi:hypothetical protein
MFAVNRRNFNVKLFNVLYQSKDVLNGFKFSFTTVKSVEKCHLRNFERKNQKLKK